jgi:uncharacterized protein
MSGSLDPRERDFAGGTGKLADLGSIVAVIITHPWGVLGGNMHNPVVVAAAQYFQTKVQVTTLRFDFCGSQIGFGTAQVRQLVQLAQDVIEETAARHILLVGYSYGALIAASITTRTIPSLIGLVAIAPAFGVAHWLFCFQSDSLLRLGKDDDPDLPRLLIMGDADNFTDRTTLATTVQKYYPSSSKSVVLEGGVDHFFRSRKERELMNNIIGHWLLETFPQRCRNGDLTKFGVDQDK